MRVRTAKTLAERIDLYYFKRATGMRRWRYLLSAALPLAAVVWVSVFAASGNRMPYSAGPVSAAHAFAEDRCEVCHAGSADRGTPRDPQTPRLGFRSHTTDQSCLACHDAPQHAANQTPAPGCATCHQEHRGRVQSAKTDERFCVECHGALRTTQSEPQVSRNVGVFPLNHPEFAAVRAGSQDPARIRFNHAVHLNEDLRGPKGREKLECATCHKPETARAGRRARGPDTTGLMAPISYQVDCARCHPLFFDERLDQPAPHVKPETVRAFVRQALEAYIRERPGDIAKPDTAVRRVPLNFPRPPEPAARSPQEWVTRRAAADERLLWSKTCAECHEPAPAAAPAGPSLSATASPGQPAAGPPLPIYAPSNIPKQWMPRAAFDHTPHLMLKCASCHAAEGSTRTSDVLLPNLATCASCHAPSAGARPGPGQALRPGSGQAESRCFECHRYHDWTKARPPTAFYSLPDFR